MAQRTSNPRIVPFGVFELDLEARELRKSGVKIRLQDQPFQVLSLLLERPGEIITREELQKKLWPGDTFVDFDLSLNSAVKKLRQALNDDSENPRFVETLYRRGYRFIGLVNATPDSSVDQLQLAESPATTAPPEPGSTPSVSRAAANKKRWIYATAVLLVVLAGMVAYRFIPSPPPRVLGFTQLTHDGLLKFQFFSDGERIYVHEVEGDHFVVGQVSVAGGEGSVLPTPFVNVSIDGITPDGSALVVSSFQGTGSLRET